MASPSPRDQAGQEHMTLVVQSEWSSQVLLDGGEERSTPLLDLWWTALHPELLQAFCYQEGKPEDQANTRRRAKPRAWQRNGAGILMKPCMKTDTWPVWGGFSFVCSQEHPNWSTSSNGSVTCGTTALWKSDIGHDLCSQKKKTHTQSLHRI